jgi:cytochrome c biogenesis protein CcmG, thiol:disulfide interchange protein DsbE
MEHAERQMTSRWIAAGAAACAVALLTVPWMIKGARTSHATAAAAPAATTAATTTGKGEAAKLDLVVKDMNGAAVRLADYKGKVILLNFWATWCGPCQAEIPELVNTYAEYKDRGVVILGVSIDDTAETLRAYAAQKQMQYPVLLMQDDVDQAYGPIFGVPVTFFIGRDGTISKKHFGPVTKEQVDQEIKALL